MKTHTKKVAYLDSRHKRVKKIDAVWKVTAHLDRRGCLLQEEWLRFTGRRAMRLIVFLDDAHRRVSAKQARWMVQTDYGSLNVVRAECWIEIAR